MMIRKIKNMLSGWVVFAASFSVFAAETTKEAVEAVASKDLSSGYGLVAIAAGLGIGLAAFGGALGQGKAAAAALEGIARNPGAEAKVFKPLILGLALIESLVIYALLISFFLIAKI